MQARIYGMMLVVGGALLVTPAEWSPVETVAANCIQIEGVDDCFNGCMEAAGAYNTVRRETGTEDKAPPMYCLA